MKYMKYKHASFCTYMHIYAWNAYCIIYYYVIMDVQELPDGEKKFFSSIRKVHVFQLPIGKKYVCIYTHILKYIDCL